MAVAHLLRQLGERSHVEIESLDPDLGDLAEAKIVLREMAEQAALELAFTPPRFSNEAAAWAAAILYRGCQFIVNREVSAAQIDAALRAACPQPVSPEVCFSVDLALRYLPDLIRLARGVAQDDPLVASLMGLARRWPLSSVGVRDLGPVDVQPFWRHAALRQLYVDRVMQRGDLQRLADPAVREAVRAAVGIYPNLAGKLAGPLQEVDSR